MRQDWRKIQTDYMRGGMSLRQIALKYGASQSAVFRRASKENWVEKRQQQASKALARAQARAQETAANRLAAKLERLDELADRLTAELEKALGDDKQLYRYIVGAGPGVQEEQTLKILDVRRAKDLTDCIKALKELATPPEDETEQEEVRFTLEDEGNDRDPDPAEPEAETVSAG